MLNEQFGHIQHKMYKRFYSSEIVMFVANSAANERPLASSPRKTSSVPNVRDTYSSHQHA